MLKMSRFADFASLPILFAAALVLLPPSHSSAKTRVDDKLKSVLETCPSDSVLDVMFYPPGSYDVSEFKAILDSKCRTLDERRRLGESLLKQRAQETQAQLLPYLKQLKNSGRIESYESHWLASSIEVKAAASEIQRVISSQPLEAVGQPLVGKPIEFQDQGIRDFAKAARSPGGVEENLKFIGADSAWRMGYAGKGRIICVLDVEGVDGSHPALYGNFRGRNGNFAESWLGAHTQDSIPIGEYHGTHITGILCGHDDATGDTIGVALDAEWIGSDNAGIIGMEWAMDPDGNPNTTADVPDVISSSTTYGPSSCEGPFVDLVATVEALGTVMIFAAGNDGPDPYSIIPVADIATDSLSGFCVGSVDHRNGLVRFSSSRGPSKCNESIIKPNVTAPGVDIRSCVVTENGPTYELHGGTSMATPHVAGAVAILRQVAPNATSDEIKEALIAGCTPVGDTSPNFDYGYGIINIPRSIEWLQRKQWPTADLRIDSFSMPSVGIADTLSVPIGLFNRGGDADDIYMKFDPQQNSCRVLTDSLYFGTINRGGRAMSQGLFRSVFSDTLYAGATVTIRGNVYSGESYLQSVVIRVQVGRPGKPEVFTHATKRIVFGVCNSGQFGVPEVDNLGGFCLDGGSDRIINASLLIATGSHHVIDDARSDFGYTDKDFWIDSSSEMQIRRPGASADEETVCSFTDGNAEGRLGLEVTQHSFSWSDSASAGLVVLEYEIRNISGRTLESVYAGALIQWNVGFHTSLGGVARFDGELGLSYVYGGPNAFGTYRDFSGAMLLSGPAYSNTVVHGYNLEIPDSVKFTALSAGEIEHEVVVPSHGRPWFPVLGAQPATLQPGQSFEVAFAIVAGRNENELLQFAQQAQERYRLIKGEVPLPQLITLRQNYPNPFNASTRIEFFLDAPVDVKLDVFNILGQRVTQLMNQRMPRGTHIVDWQGTDASGNAVASGVYFISLSSGDYRTTRKMVYLK